ncbi:hypothetical protein IAT38_003036 [Cryptococcus sp. DSM 104549]
MLPTGQQQPNRDRTEWSGWAPSTASSHDQHSSPHPAHTQAQPRTTTMEAGTASHLPVMAQGAAFTSEGASDVPGYTSQHPRLVFQPALAPFVEQLKDRHAKVLKDRQEVTKGQHEAERQMKGWPLALTPAAAEWKMLQVQQWEA